MASRRGQKRGGRHPAAPELPVPLTLREDPFLVRGGRRKVLVSATLENRMENAYNTSLRLSFSRNLHLASFTPQVPGAWEGGGGGGVWGLCPPRPVWLQGKAGCSEPAAGERPQRWLPPPSLPAEGPAGEGGVRGPRPPRPALRRGASRLSHRGQGRSGPRMGEGLCEGAGWSGGARGSGKGAPGLLFLCSCP